MADTNESKPERPQLPLSDLQQAAGDRPDERAAVDDFHSEFSSPAPDPARLDAHAQRLRAFAAIAGPFERWWLDPRVQAFIAELNATGI